MAVNGIQPFGWISLLLGFAILVYMLFGWFGQVIGESENGVFNKQVDVSFRWSMSWFIFSEVMFFAAFFGALFYARTYSVPWLADIDNSLIWQGYDARWPTAGPARMIPSCSASGPTIKPETSCTNSSGMPCRSQRSMKNATFSALSA